MSTCFPDLSVHSYTHQTPLNRKYEVFKLNKNNYFHQIIMYN